jgi:hypothetical protein
MQLGINLPVLQRKILSPSSRVTEDRCKNGSSEMLENLYLTAQHQISEESNVKYQSSLYGFRFSHRSEFRPVFWVVTLCSLVGAYKHFGEIHCNHLQGISESSGMWVGCL